MNNVGNPARSRITASARGAARVIMRGWKWNPGVRSGDQLTLGERAADKMRNGMGSWTFVFAACGFLALWMLVNALLKHAHGTTFDPYPFILLNLLLSCVAALQGAILLIAARRSDQISSELAQSDYAADMASHELLKGLCEQVERLTMLLEERQIKAEEP